MTIECGVITGILIAFSVIFFRTKHKEWALATLPLTLVPLTEFVLTVLFVNVFDMSVSIYWGVFALVAAVAMSCAWIGFVSNRLKSRKTRATYIGIANAFNVLLAAILINNILSVVREYGATMPR